MQPISRKCAACRGSNDEEMMNGLSCCPMGSTGCEKCVGRPYVCPVRSCGTHYVRRWAYETGSGRTSVGRNPAQFKVLPFTPDMHCMVEEWNKHSVIPYNNVVLVSYCGADMCAHCACGQKHGSIQCGSVLHMHQDNGQGVRSSNSQAVCAVNRTLNLGEKRVLTMCLVKHLGGSLEREIVDSQVDFQLTHGSEFLLDTADEVEAHRNTPGGPTRCSWKHGMLTPIRSNAISCGLVGRSVKHVCDVRSSDDVVIDAHYRGWVTSARAEDFRAGAEEWDGLCATYEKVVGPRVVKALQAWDDMRDSRTSRHVR